MFMDSDFWLGVISWISNASERLLVRCVNIYLKHVMAQSPHDGVVWKLGECGSSLGVVLVTLSRLKLMRVCLPDDTTQALQRLGMLSIKFSISSWGILHHSSRNALRSSGRQNDIPIDVVCHRYTLNMQVNSGTKTNSSLNASHPAPP
ncbi:hypothetical protein TNCV_387821 [Trichonephila clavipes]|nr:hypothetical protein TNCV_387821 [Trichonephila clavipes]